MINTRSGHVKAHGSYKEGITYEEKSKLAGSEYNSRK